MWEINLKTKKLQILMFHDNERELFGIERGNLLERCDELEHVVPLSVENELTQEEHIVGELRVDNARLTLQIELWDVQFTRLQELNDQFDYVPLR